MFKGTKHWLASALLGQAVLMAATNVSAGVQLQQETFSGNDCVGEFGSPFANCAVPDPNGGDPLSAIMAKFDAVNDEITGDIIDFTAQFNTAVFPSLDGSEFSVDPASANGGTGFFTYTPGAGDPLLRYWVAKAANGFILYYLVDTDVGTSRADAIAVTDGFWVTPQGPQGPRGLSHITFYDTTTGSNGGGSATVPEPSSSALALIAVGALAATFRYRRRKRQ